MSGAAVWPSTWGWNAVAPCHIGHKVTKDESVVRWCDGGSVFLRNGRVAKKSFLDQKKRGRLRLDADVDGPRVCCSTGE